MLNKVIFHVYLSTWSVNLVPTTHKGLELGLNKNMALYVEIKLRRYKVYVMLSKR